MIEFEAVSRRYAGRAVIDRLSFSVAAREMLVVVGPSGCGKTTCLKMINRLIDASEGVVRVGGVDTREFAAHELRRRVGYGFQQVGLFPHLSVAENIGLTPSLLGWEPARIAERVDTLLASVQLEPADFRDRDPASLSGGQRQRVGLARAVAAEPELLLLDEPFGALDPPTRDQMQQLLQRLRRELELTVIFVTHDMSEALLLADRIAVLEAGRLVQIGTPAELVRAPATERVAALLDAPQRQARAVEALLAGSEA